MSNKRLKHIEDIRHLSQSGTSRTKIVCTNEFYGKDHAEINL